MNQEIFNLKNPGGQKQTVKSSYRRKLTSGEMADTKGGWQYYAAACLAVAVEEIISWVVNKCLDYTWTKIQTLPGATECFAAGTKVTMGDGSLKNIEDVRVGEVILSYNVYTRSLEEKKVSYFVTQVHNLKDGDLTVRITFSNGVVTHNTIANPFWSRDKGFVAVDEERCNRLHSWVRETNSAPRESETMGDSMELRETATAVALESRDIEALNVGDVLYWHNAAEERLQEVTVENVEYVMEPGIRTYDIEVQDNHTFFANGILTHNTNGPGGGNGGGMYVCFTEDMEVEMANGEKRRIADIRVGDYVRTMGMSDGKITSEPVLKVHRGVSDHFLSINGGKLELTPNHVVYVQNKEMWLKAETLIPGDRLLDASGSEIEVTRIDTMKGRRPRFNLALSKKGNVNLLVNGLLVSSSVAELAENVVQTRVLRGKALGRLEREAIIGGS